MLNNIHYYLKNYTLRYALLILIALSGAILPGWYFNKASLITPIILGVIAAALAESDDNTSGRMKAQIITIISFIIATFSIELLFDHPTLFVIGLFSSTVGFIMLGAIGPRYAKIAFGSLLIAIYTMLGASESTNVWFQPLLLITGAVWYFILTNIWHTLSPLQPVQQSLADVFQQLSANMLSKRALFHPVSDMTPQPYRIQEASQNAKTVQALNQCKATFLSRSNRGQVDSTSSRFLNIYFIAQDIHERISSSHDRYQDLAKIFKRSDILFRFKYLLELYSEACSRVASAMRSGSHYHHSGVSSEALQELQQSIHYLESSGNAEWQQVLPKIKYLYSNLIMVEKLLANISNPDATQKSRNDLLEDTEAHTLSAMWERIRANLTPDSLLFRHAIRLSTALVAGYAIIREFDIGQGYWILLTILFVCQPNYSATRQKLVSRIGGTVAGLVTGVLLLTLFPSQLSQFVFIIISGVAFFVFRENNYSYATTFITILVLFCFEQLGEGYAVILPRMSDTLIGCVLSVIAVTFILPDWQSRRLHKIMAESVKANCHYLGEIIGQYRVGKSDDLKYRIARRNAHNNNAGLSSAISNMLMEPGRYQSAKDESFRFLTLNHAMLGYISAMGAHREKINDKTTHLLILEAHGIIHQHLEALYQQLYADCENCEPVIDISSIESKLIRWQEGQSESANFVLHQLHLILQMMPEIHKLANTFAKSK